MTSSSVACLPPKHISQGARQRLRRDDGRPVEAPLVDAHRILAFIFTDELCGGGHVDVDGQRALSAGRRRERRPAKAPERLQGVFLEQTRFIQQFYFTI